MDRVRPAPDYPLVRYPIRSKPSIFPPAYSRLEGAVRVIDILAAYGVRRFQGNRLEVDSAPDPLARGEPLVAVPAALRIRPGEAHEQVLEAAVLLQHDDDVRDRMRRRRDRLDGRRGSYRTAASGYAKLERYQRKRSVAVSRAPPLRVGFDAGNPRNLSQLACYRKERHTYAAFIMYFGNFGYCAWRRAAAQLGADRRLSRDGRTRGTPSCECGRTRALAALPVRRSASAVRCAQGYARCQAWVRTDMHGMIRPDTPNGYAPSDLQTAYNLTPYSAATAAERPSRSSTPTTIRTPRRTWRSTARSTDFRACTRQAAASRKAK